MSFGDKRTCYTTTSWDDGHPLDLRIADLLDKYEVPGTFYIPLTSVERKVMSERNIIEIASRHEVGGHTVHHLDLTRIPLPKAIREVCDCKQRLESLTGQDIRMFAYPKGRYNDQVIRIVKDAGFLGARTACWFHIDPPRNPYLMHPTINASLHYRIVDIAHLLRRWNPAGLVRYIFVSRLNSNWKTMAIQWFEHVCRHGGVWHLWGHSWEVDQLDLWEDLEEVLRYVARRGGIKYRTNAQVLNERQE